MDDTTRQALARSQTIDITTTGRRTGAPRRIEIVFFNFDGRIYISGRPSPRRRSWLANLEADPGVTFHLKGAVTADLPATARIVTDPPERRTIAEWVVANAWHQQDVEAMTSYAPMIKVTIKDAVVA